MTDLSNLSDVQLKAMYAAPVAAPKDLSALSDDELRSAYKAAPAPMGNAVTDIIPEIKNAANENIDAIKGGFGGHDKKSVFQGFLDTGKAALAVPGLIASPITGAARSLLGHPLADAIHGAGTIINPEVAAKDNPQQMYEDAKGGVDKAMMGARPAGASPVGIRPGPAPATPSGAALRADAVDTYNNPAIKSIKIPTSDAAILSTKIENDLLQQGFRPTSGSAPGTLTEVKAMTPSPKVADVSVDDIRASRRALNLRAQERDAIGKPTPDAAAATSAIRHIDSFLDNITPELREANANYSAGKLDQTLDYRNIRAEHRAAKTGSGSNIENTMRQEVDKIPNSGLRPDEIVARDQIVEGTTVRNALRKVGKLGFGDGVSLMYHAAAAIPTGGASVPIGIAATAARKIGEMLTRSEIRALSNQIRARSPTAQALMAAPRNPATISAQTRLIASTLLGQPGRSGMAIPGAMMPANAQQQQQ